MTPAVRSLAKKLTPPILWDSARHVIQLVKSSAPCSAKPREQEAGYYDAVYYESDDYKLHYTASRYYAFWCVLVDRMMRAGVDSVLDIGCGPGQFAALLRDKGVSKYCGFDFSEARIDAARAVCPEFQFVVADARTTDLFDTADYAAAVCTEFLEHVKEDIEILRRIRKGARVYATVPNFPFVSHVRHFESREQVRARYQAELDELQVDPFLANQQGKTLYLLEGIRA